MDKSLVAAAPTARRRTAPCLAGRPALYLLASVIVSLLAASSASTPLYAIYRARWGFTPITATVVFAVYAVAVLFGLLVLGRLSDHTGRRPVLLVALTAQVVSLVVLTTANGVPGLLAARIIQGVSAGAALGAIGAGMLDIDRPWGTLANAVSPGTGAGLGSILSALAVRYLPAPTHLIYLVLLGVIVVQAAGVAMMQETVTRSGGAFSSLLPEIRLPRSVRAHILTAGTALFAIWALSGLYGALGPALVQALTGSDDVVLGGLSLTVLTAFGAVAIVVLRNAPARMMMLAGIGSLMLGVAVTLLALTVRSAALFFAGTAVSGFGFGGGFQGSICTVVPRVAAHERGGVLSLLFVICYLGLGVPAVAAGFLATHGVGIIGAARYYGAALIVLGGFALLALIRGDRNEGKTIHGSEGEAVLAAVRNTAL